MVEDEREGALESSLSVVTVLLIVDEMICTCPALCVGGFLEL
jgi:hypothetical protein